MGAGSVGGYIAFSVAVYHGRVCGESERKGEEMGNMRHGRSVGWGATGCCRRIRELWHRWGFRKGTERCWLGWIDVEQGVGDVVGETGLWATAGEMLMRADRGGLVGWCRQC